MAFFDTTWYVNYGNGTTTGYYAVAAWTTGAKSAGAVCRQSTTPTVGNERIFVAVVAGSSGASEPTWVLTRGAKTTDGTVTWMEATGQPALCGDTTNSVVSATVRSHAVSQGQVILDAGLTHVFICTTAGTPGASDPAWNTTAVGNTTTDGSATWTYIGLASSFAAFANPHDRLANALGTNWGNVAGTVFFVGDNHAETQSTAITLAFPTAYSPSCQVLCVDHTIVPPTAASLKTTATITSSASSITNMYGYYAYGVTFVASTGFITNSSGAAASVIFDTCGFTITGTLNVTFASSPAGVAIYVLNSTFTTANSSSSIIAGASPIIFRNLTLAGAAVPGTLFVSESGSGSVLVEASDLSAIGAGKLCQNTIKGHYTFKGCKLSSSTTPILTTSQITPGARVDLVNCDSSTGEYIFSAYASTGQQINEPVLVRTSGANDNGTTSYSWRIDTYSWTEWANAFWLAPLAVYNTVTGVARTATVEGIWDAAVLPTTAQIWMDTESPSTAGSTLGVVGSSGVNALSAGSNLTASTQAWDSLVTARANSAVYTSGQMIKTASNPGRVFFCTTGGTSAAAEPGGYSTAVDGGSVTDGTAVFRAGVRFKLAVTMTAPQYAGLIYAYLRTGLTSGTFWVDPVITLS